MEIDPEKAKSKKKESNDEEENLLKHFQNQSILELRISWMDLKMDKLKLKMWINRSKFSGMAVALCMWTAWAGITITGPDRFALWLEVWIFPCSIQTQFPSPSMTMIYVH